MAVAQEKDDHVVLESGLNPGDEVVSVGALILDQMFDNAQMTLRRRGGRKLRQAKGAIEAMITLMLALTIGAAAAGDTLKVGVFAVDASPPVGSPLAYDPTRGVEHPLSCRGVVLVGEGPPVVLCAVDWIGIANDGQVEFRRALAGAAGTDPERVAVHTLHQHDAPFCDFSTDRVLAATGSTARSPTRASPAT